LDFCGKHGRWAFSGRGVSPFAPPQGLTETCFSARANVR
jgi:hypothetical protein